MVQSLQSVLDSFKSQGLIYRIHHITSPHGWYKESEDHFIFTTSETEDEQDVTFHVVYDRVREKLYFYQSHPYGYFPIWIGDTMYERDVVCDSPEDLRNKLFQIFNSYNVKQQ